MPFVPDKDRPHDDTMTYGEHCRHMKKVHGELDRATATVTRLEPFEAKSIELESTIAAMPDGAKATKRADKAEARATEWETKYNAATAEYTTEKALLTAGITDAEDMALVRYKYGQSGQDDFAKYLEGDARQDKHLASMFGGGSEDAPTPKPNGNAPTPKVNGGVQPPKAPPKVLTARDIANMPNSWHADPANREAINIANGVAYRNKPKT